MAFVEMNRAKPRRKGDYLFTDTYVGIRCDFIEKNFKERPEYVVMHLDHEKQLLAFRPSVEVPNAYHISPPRHGLYRFSSRVLSKQFVAFGYPRHESLYIKRVGSYWVFQKTGEAPEGNEANIN